MVPLLAVAVMTTMLQQTPAAAAPDSSQQLLVAAIAHMNAQRTDSAAILLRRVAEAPAWLPENRVRAWVMLGVVDFYRTGDSAAAYALRQALALDPNLQTPALERNYPEVARILAVERAALVPSSATASVTLPVPPPAPVAAPAPTATPSSTDSTPALLDCLSRCAAGGRPPQFLRFPDMQFSDSDAGIGVTERRLRSFLTFQAVIGADGIIEPETVQVTGGAARGMEAALRRGLAQSRFAPGRLNDVPIRTRVTLRFDFESEGTSRLKYSYKVTAR